jgi:hypothetical protein
LDSRAAKKLPLLVKRFPMHHAKGDAAKSEVSTSARNLHMNRYSLLFFSVFPRPIRLNFETIIAR